MTDRRKLYTGEESAGRGLMVLRLASVAALLLAVLFIIFFDRAKHDVGLVRVNPFSEDPCDAVGSFGVQIGFACSILAVVRAFRTDLRTESLFFAAIANSEGLGSPDRPGQRDGVSLPRDYEERDLTA